MIECLKLTTDNSCIAIAIKDGKKFPVVVVEPFFIYRIYPDDPNSFKDGFMKKFTGFIADEPSLFDDYDDVHSPVDNEWNEVMELWRQELWSD